MKIRILGATGPTGQCLVQHALNDGHDVTAVVRNPKKFPETILKHERFHHITGDIFSADSLKPCLDGAEVVFSCLGRQPTTTMPFTTMTFYTESAKAIVGAMKQSNTACRLIVMSSWCVQYDASSPKYVEWILKPFLIGRHLEDMHRMEQYLQSEKDLDFVVVRPPGLTDEPSAEKPILTEEGQNVKKHNLTRSKWGWSMPRTDVAKFMLNCATDDQWSRKCVAIAV